VWAQFAANRYALILEDPPVSSKLTARAASRSAVVTTYAQQVEARQQSLLHELAGRNIAVTGRVATLANAVFVSASKDRVAELKSLPGVKGVVPVRFYKRKLNRATQLVNVQGAWNISGGEDSAGKGVKIAILDTGIDQKHAAFQDSSLATPAGYPICSGTDCAYTSNKVIVARSYVRQLAAGTGSDPAADSRPDDYSPRDHVGHGTAVAAVAAGVSNGGTVTASGMAPKAYLGNYKIYGSPYINDGTSDEVIIQALDDAFNDGMDIVSFSTGGPAFSGPLDTGAACGNDDGVPCDLMAQAFENAVTKGMIIVAAAGNEGDTGANYPAFGTIASPASAPSVIAAGAITNSHAFTPIVTMPGSDAPSSLKAIATATGDSLSPLGAVTLPLRDVTSTGNDGLACTALPDHSLDGTFALIQRGSCNFSDKLTNAWNAGAMGAIFYMADDSAIFGPGGLSSFTAPAAMISQADGLALKQFIAANPDHLVTLNPGGIEQDSASYNQLASYSSLGPATGTSAIKPDLVATGSNVYMPTQNYDLLSDMYSADGYVVANGTSFATPLVSGAAAIVKQLHPTFTPAQVRSALVNSTTHDVSMEELNGNALDVRSLGAGKLDAGAAAAATVTANPSSISFGALTSAALPATQTIDVANTGSAAVTLAAAVVAEKASSTAQLTLDPQTLALAPGATAKLTIGLTGTLPAAGYFSGNITLIGSGISLKVPYLFLVGNGVAANMIPLTNGSFEGVVGGPIYGSIISFRLVDAYGVPVTGAPVSFTTRGGVTLQSASTATDAYGIAYAVPILPPAAGRCFITAVAGGMHMTFSGSAYNQPAIASGGVVNGASFDPSAPIAPGSYVTIFGKALTQSTNYPTTSTLPMVLDYAMVSFDVPSAGISVLGRITYISPTQINVQVPWELQGQPEARVKVILDQLNGTVVTVPLADYSPAFFEVGSGAVAALDTNYALVSTSNPTSSGKVVMLFANGLGPVTHQPASGEPAPYNPLAETKVPPTVTIGGKKADVGFSGLAPGFAGLYQINVTIPSGLTAGNQPVTVSIGGTTSKTSNIAVQ
jgi:minor extracellular serine protease Vpr